MLDVGQLISFKTRPDEPYVVVMVNDCRALIVPMAGRDPLSQSLIVREDDSKGQSICPNSDVNILGRIRGTVERRSSSIFTTRAPAEKFSVIYRQEKKRKVNTSPMPSIPSDPRQDGISMEIVGLIETASKSARTLIESVIAT